MKRAMSEAKRESAKYRATKFFVVKQGARFLVEDESAYIARIKRGNVLSFDLIATYLRGEWY